MAILSLALTKSSATGQTLNKLIASVREWLQDEATPYRYSDNDIVEAYNDFFLEARRLRPDLFTGIFSDDLPVYSSADGAEEFPLSAEFFVAAKYFVAGTISLRDDQYAQDGRALGFVNRAVAVLVTGAA